MFKPRQNDSEHQQLYEWGCEVKPASQLEDRNLGHMEQTPSQTPPHQQSMSATDDFKQKSQQDDLKHIKKHINLSKPYEMYMLTERNSVLRDNKEEREKDPMEKVAKKIKMGRDLTYEDYRSWINYNYLCFSKSEQARIDTELLSFSRWWLLLQFVCPVAWYTSAGVLRNYSKFNRVASACITAPFVFGFYRFTLSQAEARMKTHFEEIYHRNKDEVQKEKYRGLKLYWGKQKNQVDQKAHTSSNFEDLKRLLSKNKS